MIHSFRIIPDFFWRLGLQDFDEDEVRKLSHQICWNHIRRLMSKALRESWRGSSGHFRWDDLLKLTLPSVNQWSPIFFLIMPCCWNWFKLFAAFRHSWRWSSWRTWGWCQVGDFENQEATTTTQQPWSLCSPIHTFSSLPDTHPDLPSWCLLSWGRWCWRAA